MLLAHAAEPLPGCVRAGQRSGLYLLALPAAKARLQRLFQDALDFVVLESCGAFPSHRSHVEILDTSDSTPKPKNSTALFICT